MAAAPGIVTASSPPNTVVAVQPGMNVQPIILVDQNGQYVAPGTITATLANVASSASSVTLFAAAATQVNERTVFNDSTQVLYLTMDGSVASASNYTVQIAGGGYYEFPRPVVSGKVTGIWASANGNARLTSW